MTATLGERVPNSAEQHLAVQGHVTTVEVLRGIGWLDSSHYFDWIDCCVPLLESMISASRVKLAASLQAFEEWGDS